MTLAVIPIIPAILPPHNPQMQNKQSSHKEPINSDLSMRFPYNTVESASCKVLHDAFRNLLGAIGFDIGRIYCQAVTFDHIFFYSLAYDFCNYFKKMKGYIPVSTSVYKIDEELFAYNKDSDEWFCFIGNQRINCMNTKKNKRGKT